MTIYVDHTHLGRHVTGLERITIELFSPSSLPSLSLAPVTATGTAGMMTAQTIGLPARMLSPANVLLCPGFPPTPLLLPFADRVIPYIHDLFLMSRLQDLNPRARLYMAKPFKLAVERYPHFLVNSLETRRALAAHCRKDARIVVYRPRVRNIFELTPPAHHDAPGTALRLVSLGTVEPRKNYAYAARILAALRGGAFPDATLEIIGRKGWGDDWDSLSGQPGLTLTGYQTTDEVKRRIEQAGALLCTSHEEGLGLPLLEAQYAGVPVIAPDDAIFREVLAGSGIFIDRSNAAVAAATITAILTGPDRRQQFRKLGADNLVRWNALADADRDNVVQLIASLRTRHAKRIAPAAQRPERSPR
ncbi:MAG: glycosyl transferase [Proteobacteria bacterium SG_bin9]|nr:MAG: glycosyl transferase [Proteobacteria bacterium SG_bin9]